MLKSPLLAAAFVVVIASCSTQNTETASSADSTAAPQDTVFLSAAPTDGRVDETGDSPDQSDSTDVVEGGEFILTNQYSYISSPFGFSLDSASLVEILGEGVEITSVYTEGGEYEEGGSYPGYTYYEATFENNEVKFFDYSGKHWATIYTPLLPLKNDIKVGDTKESFIEKMEITNPNAIKADTFTINDDYGWMSFYFTDGVLTSVSVSYEEGT